MESCILTVIKNEHEYLDEWIRYHLELGVDHIFIFEDTDSDSHKEICDKYNGKVSLDSVLVFLNDEERKTAQEVKRLKTYSVHHMYLKNGLTYIQRTHPNEYDWCFTIDNDEFITLENENDTLGNVLTEFETYDVFIMSWKCYGANGHIKKPDYGNTRVVDTYTKEVKLDAQKQIKPCYNLKTFKSDFFSNVHYPSSNCKWCNTSFERRKNAQSLGKIYLRHYITKSWEEYVWKRKVRGFMWGNERSFDFFFKANPDMIDKRQELINSINEEKLVVLPYKQSGSQGNEIRICLKGWRKFCRFKYHFVVIGEFDNSLVSEFPWIEFIYLKSVEKRPDQYNPHLDIQNKFKTIARLYSKIYDGFIYITDDEYAVKPFELADIMRIHCHSFEFTGDKTAPTSYWNYDKWKTRQLLDSNGLPHINYTTHFPCWFDFKKFLEIQKRFNMLEESYVFDDVYFNYFEHEEPVLDDTIRLGIWNYDIYKNEFRNAIENQSIKFVCNSVKGWSKDLEKDLEKIVQTPV